MFLPMTDIFQITPEITEMAPPLACPICCFMDDEEFEHSFKHDLLGWAEFGYGIQATKTDECIYRNSVFSEVVMTFSEFEYSDVQSLTEISIAGVVNRKGLSHLYLKL